MDALNQTRDLVQRESLLDGPPIVGAQDDDSAPLALDAKDLVAGENLLDLAFEVLTELTGTDLANRHTWQDIAGSRVTPAAKGAKIKKLTETALHASI